MNRGKKKPDEYLRRTQQLLAEVVGVEVSRETVERMLTDIRDGTATFLGRRSCNLTLFSVSLLGGKVVVRYNHASKSIDAVSPAAKDEASTL